MITEKETDGAQVKTLSPRKIKTIKIAVIAVIGLLAAYCLYATVGQLLKWLNQPRFISVSTGKVAVSTGFFVQLVIFGILFLALTITEIVLIVKFFRKKQPAGNAPSDGQADIPAAALDE